MDTEKKSDEIISEKTRNDEQNIGNKLPGVALCILLILFVFYLCQSNVVLSDYNTRELEINAEKVASLQKGDVAKVQREISLSDKMAKNGSSHASKRVWYMERFQNCVVVGDSLTDGLKVYQWLSKKQVFSSVGASIIVDGKLFRKAAKTYPTKAFFAFGMNDMGNYRGNAKNFIKKYNSLLKEVQKKSPKTEIYICSITTPTKSAIKRKKVLGNYKKFNKAIEQMCKDEGYTYVDTTQILPSHKKLYAGDGIHAASAYYPLWMNKMIEVADL
jgi:hypothetical protein